MFKMPASRVPGSVALLVGAAGLCVLGVGGIVVASGARSPVAVIASLGPGVVALFPLVLLRSATATGIALAVLRRLGAILTLTCCATVIGILVAWIPLAVTLTLGCADRLLRVGRQVPLHAPLRATRRCALSVASLTPAACVEAATSGTAYSSMAGPLFLVVTVVIATNILLPDRHLQRVALSSAANLGAVAAVLAAALHPVTLVLTVPAFAALVWGEREARLSIKPRPAARPAPPVRVA